MGKKRSKKKGTKPPPDPRTLPFLQEMFPNIEKDIVEMVYEQNEYDEEKTMQLLTEMSSNDGSNPYAGILDEEDNDLDETLDNFNSIGINSKNNTPTNHTTNHNSITPKKHNPPNNNNNEPFISTSDDFVTTYSNKRHSPQKSFTPISTNNNFTSTSKPSPSSVFSSSSSSKPTPSSSSSSSSSSKPTSSRSSLRLSSTGESGAFLSSMFPELDPTMVSLLYEENGSDVGKTVESLLSIVFMNHSTNEDEEEADVLDEVESEALAEVADEEEEILDEDEYDEALEDGKDEESESEEDYIVEIEDEVGDEDDYYEEGAEEQVMHFDNGEFKFTIPQPVVQEELNESVSVAAKSEFIQNLKLLAELFPETPRTLLALELDEHDGNLEKTIASCCRADPEYLQKLSGEKGITIPVEAPKEEKKYPTPVNQVLKPSWIRKGASKPEIKYVKPPPPPPTTTSKTKRKKSSKSKSSSKSAATSSTSKGPMDLAAKLKLKQLREKFNFVDPDILEAVFVQSGHKVHATLVCLYDIYPHLRDASINAPAPKRKKTEPGSPEEPLTRKQNPPTTTTTTTTTTTSTTPSEKPKPKPKRRPITDEDEEDEGEFVTVSYRKKKGESSASGNGPTPATKKVLDSEDIENTYQSYREKAVKAGEMRNHLFMQAAAAYQAGDGARAKALSQRGREYDDMMKDAHKQACHQIFIDCNARFDTLASVDLHGLHVAEALQVISQLLEIHSQMGETTKRPRNLRVITGVGKHSIKGIAKIKPAVKNFLRSKGHRFAETEAGVITISLSH